MARPKGSKNKTIEQKVEELIEEVKELPVEEKEKLEAINELEDLLNPDLTIAVSQDNKGKLIGYHPVTGAEIWM